MNNKPQNDTVELTVENFGSIAEAKIELRPLTVFVGPSNTGKSYMAMLIYSLHKFFENNLQSNRWSVPSPLSYIRQHQKNKDDKIYENHYKILENWLEGAIKETVTNKKLKKSKNLGIYMPNDVFNIIQPFISNIEERSKVLELEIQRCFSVGNIVDLIRHQKRSSGKAQVSVGKKTFDSSSESSFTKFNILIGKKGVRLDTVIPPNPDLQISYIDRYIVDNKREALRELLFLLNDRNQYRFDYIANELATIFRVNVVGPLASSCYYFPADRTGIMHSHRTVVSSLVKRAAMGGLRSELVTPMLSGVVADFLSKLISLDINGRHSSHKSSLGDQIEQEMLKGTINIEASEIGYPEFLYLPNNWQRSEALPLVNTSSMISELTPIIVYLRHIVNRGDVVIIEEPESHLHPAMQVEFTNQLARLVQSGVRVIVTTHSELVLEKLANLVAKSQVKQANMNGELALQPKQVGAWLFEPKRKPMGSVVKEISFDVDNRFLPEDYDDVGRLLYNEWAILHSDE